MLRKAFTIASKDIRLFFRDPGAIGMSYLAPAVILLIFGVIYSGMSGEDSEIEIELLYVDQVQNEQSEAFLENLAEEDVFTIYTHDPDSDEGSPLTKERAIKLIEDGDFGIALVYEGSRELEDFPVVDQSRLKIYYDPAYSMEREITAGMVQRAAFLNLDSDLPGKGMDLLLEELDLTDTPAGGLISNFMDSLTEEKQDDDESEDGGGSGMMLENLVQIENEEIIQPEVRHGNYFMANTVSGLIVMFLLFFVSFSAASILKEQQEGTIKRLLLAPVTEDEIILGKFLSIGFNSLGQVAVMLILSALVFNVNITGNIGPVIIMSVATVAATSAFGMILAAMARSYEQISASITVIVLVMSAVGGSMFPRILMPSWMKNVGLLTINGWSIDGFLDAMYRFKGPGAILGYGEADNLMDFIHNSEALVLVLFALLCGWIAGKLLKRRLRAG